MGIFSKLPETYTTLILGAPLTGEKDIWFDFIFEGIENGTPSVIITMDKSPEDMIKELKNYNPKIADHFEKGEIRFIDCYSRQADESVKDTTHIRRVSGPIALNEISIALSDIQKDILKSNEKHRIVLNSLSTILMYSNPNMVGRFTQVLIAKIRKAGGQALFTIEEGMHDKKVIMTMEHLMDCVINVKKENKSIMIKAMGIEGFDDWKLYE